MVKLKLTPPVKRGVRFRQGLFSVFCPFTPRLSRRRMRSPEFKTKYRAGLLALVTGIAVITTGYFAYRSMYRIVSFIHREAQPDNSLFMIKELSNDLALLENSVRLYMLTNSETGRRFCDTLIQQITFKTDSFDQLTTGSHKSWQGIDSVRKIATEKRKLWQDMLTLHENAKRIAPPFSEIYSRLAEPKTDTIMTRTEKKGFFRRLIGKNKTIIDTVIQEHKPASEEIRQEIQNLETEIAKKTRDNQVVESGLVAKNMVLNRRLNDMIRAMEKQKSDELILKTREVDRLASITYLQLAIFTVTAIALILVSLFVFSNFLKKSVKYQNALLEAREKTENLAKAKEKFVANVSHELRTPVNAIYGLTEQLLKESQDPQTKELVTIISKSSEHLRNVINDTLDFASIEAHKIKLESVDFMPHEICREVLALQKQEAERKGIDLVFNWEGNQNSVVRGDPLRLKQIMINLIGNAVKFTAKGSVTLNAVTECSNENQTVLSVKVKDTGIGIAEPDLKIIFDEFVQAENTAGKKYSGTGLGLSIVKKLVEIQGGHIKIESKPGEGTEVSVSITYLPGEIHKIPSPDGTPENIPAHFRQIHALVADDDEFNLFLIRQIFTRWGVNFTCVTNGKEAVKAALSGNFDILLMDLRMPEMDGLQAAGQIIQHIPDAFMVFISASSSESDNLAATKAGIRQFITKPFSEKELYNVLEKIIPRGNGKNQKTLPPLDTLVLEQLSGGDRSFLNEMVRLFIGSAETFIINAGEALEHHELKRISGYAHKIAPSCRQIGAKTLYEKVKLLEEGSNQDPGGESAHVLFHSVKTEMTDVISFLKLYLAGISEV